MVLVSQAGGSMKGPQGTMLLEPCYAGSAWDLESQLLVLTSLQSLKNHMWSEEESTSLNFMQGKCFNISTVSLGPSAIYFF